MVSKEMAIEFAEAKEPNWDQLDASTKAALAIMEDLNDRRGFTTDNLDDETRCEMVDSIADIIRAMLREEMGAK